VHVEFRAAARVREIDRLLHDGNGLAALAGSLQTQGDNPSGRSDESLVTRPIRPLQHFSRFDCSLLCVTLPDQDFSGR
jgi:hypothetical protein